MTDMWSDLAELYRQSAIHSASDDLDLVVEWCEPGEGVSVLDVATGGGLVARRLCEAGCRVVTVNPAPGMQADVLVPAEHLPFADGSFDAVATRLAAHHFADVLAALKEMARVAGGRVAICENYGVAEWESFFELAGPRDRRAAPHGASARDRAVARARRLHRRRRCARPRVPRRPHRRRLDAAADARHQRGEEVVPLQVLSSRLLERDHAARFCVLGHPGRTATGVPCVLESLGARVPEAWQQHLEGH